jgi:glyoxylase-like metal-dependent hydrolase (beta-lactamase superfamily II)
MEIHSIETGNFKVDGGAMFGVVPKTLWERIYPADDMNLCPCACRSMLIRKDNKVILVDTGIGDKLHPDFAKHYHMFGNDSLLNSLAKHGVSPEDVTDVIHTHLHFDHCGGTIGKSDNGDLFQVFPNANLWVSNDQWISANNPNLREKPAFLKENIQPMESSGKLRLVEKNTELMPGVELRLFNGHTHGLMAVIADTGKQRVVFAGDVMPAMPYIRLPYISAYDVEPLTALDEKQALLKEMETSGDILFFQHDINTEACSLKQAQKGIREDKTFKIKDIA